MIRQAKSIRNSAKLPQQQDAHAGLAGWIWSLCELLLILSGVTELCLTKLDVLSGLDEIQVCVGYKLNGKDVTYADVDAYGLDKVETVYQNGQRLEGRYQQSKVI